MITHSFRDSGIVHGYRKFIMFHIKETTQTVESVYKFFQLTVTFLQGYVDLICV